MALDVVGDVTAAVIAAVVGAIVGARLRNMSAWPARTIGGCVGGAVGGPYVVGLAESFLVSGAAYAFFGSLIAALPAVAAAAIVATLIGMAGEMVSAPQS